MDTADDEPRQWRLCVADDNAQTMSIEEWMSAVWAALAQQRSAVEQLARKSQDTSEELAALGSSLADGRRSAQAFRDTAAELRQRMDDLDRRLNKILAIVEEKIGGGQTEQGMQHHDYVGEYVTLVEQKITGLALEVLPDGAGATPREKAVFVAKVCAALFQGPVILEQQLIDSLSPAVSEEAVQRVREICADAADLRTKVTRGRPQHWDFVCSPGVPVDAKRQEPWTGADREGLIEFVVAPAYRVDSDTMLCKQKVFTRAAGPALDPAPAEG
jgi:hypothetical protein